MRDSSGHRARLREERIAFGLVRALAGATIIVLGAIVGFILWKGLRYSNETLGSYLPYAEAAPDGVAIVVNEAIRVGELDFETLRGIYSDEYLNWAKICADAADMVPLALDPTAPGGKAAEALLFGESPQWGGLVEYLPGPRALLDRVESTPGSIALVPESALDGGKHRYSRVPLRRLVVAMSPEAAALVDNRSVEAVDAETLDRLLDGSIGDWAGLGGPTLMVSPIAPPAGTPLAGALAGAGLAAPKGDSRRAVGDYPGLIASTPGSVGVAFAADALAAGLPTLPLKGRETGWNLDLRYLLEEPRLSGRAGGISSIIVNTLLMLLMTVAIAGPVGVAAAVYLVEYARQGRLLRLMRLGTETLAGIPSIIFGLFGMLVFVEALGFGFGLLSGCLTLSLMILPTIVRTSEEAIKAVPRTLREGSLALGATKLQTIRKVVVPAAGPGILTGLLLGIGRAVGETAALLFTMGSDYKLATGPFSSARALSTHVYLLFAEGISFDRAFSTATVLVAVVLAFNLAAKRAVGRMSRNAAN